MRRGRASVRPNQRKIDLDDGGDTDGLELASDTENVDELADFLDKPQASILVQSRAKVRKFLPPGNLKELWEHYRASQTMQGRGAVGLGSE